MLDIAIYCVLSFIVGGLVVYLIRSTKPKKRAGKKSKSKSKMNYFASESASSSCADNGSDSSSCD